MCDGAPIKSVFQEVRPSTQGFMEAYLGGGESPPKLAAPPLKYYPVYM